METPDELRAFLTVATGDGIWNRLLYRGAAWALMREDGVLPQGAPPLGATIETDLAEHGFSVLRAALALRQAAGSSDLTSRGFERAANAFEALVRNGDPDAEDRGFRRTIAAAAYHLAGFSAVAYSLFNVMEDDLNSAPAETAIMLLVLRDLDRLRTYVREWLVDDDHTDESVSLSLNRDLVDHDEAIAIILNTTICRALAFFDFALQTGELSLLESARDLLNSAINLANNAENVPLWWISKLCLNLIDDLWAHSLHVNLPLAPTDGEAEKYPQLRQMFIASLYARKNAEVELWPSQREAAERSADVTDDLVVSLPTSAGKTRVAEIAALMTLSSSKRVLIVTPLRALSAQTERSFRKTFAPLGFSVSSLYGANGISAGDEDALRTRDIVIATPEKLDFALRNNPSLIDDVGLIVLDDLRFGQRHRLRHADIDQMFGEPAGEIVEADFAARSSRCRPRQLVRKVGGQCRGYDPGSIHQPPQLSCKVAVGPDRPHRIIGGGKALRERVQIRIDAGLRIIGHDRGAPCCWSTNDYADYDWPHHTDSRRISAPCGIIPVTALCPLCRYRHKGHWSGAASRLGRDLSGSFGSKNYAREELVAEMAGAFVCASLGIAPTVRHADYIGSWLEVLREDDRAIVRAASAASKAADYLLAFQAGHAEPAGADAAASGRDAA